MCTQVALKRKNLGLIILDLFLKDAAIGITLRW